MLSVLVAASQAQTNYETILGFGPSAQMGSSPRGQLMEGSDGFLYGTTPTGGSNYSGTVFKVGKDGTGFTVIYDFTNNEGPGGALLEASPGTLWGTTAGGGTNQSGSVFKVNMDGSGYTLLLSFPPAASRMGSEGSLVKVNGGMLYGTTPGWGAEDMGTVFAVNLDGSGYTVLHDFVGATNGADGSFPYAGLCEGRDGALYGTTQNGGSNDVGTVFKINPGGTGYQVLHHFSGGPDDGYIPMGKLVQGNDGFLYGTTYYGGTAGYGTLFKLSMTGSNYTVLRSLIGPNDGTRLAAGVVAASNNELYGTAGSGGSGGGGTVFKLNPDGSGFTVLHSFSSDPSDDGSQPLAALLQASDGALYGSTSLWGPYYTTGAFGTLFKLSSSQPDPVTITAQPLDQSVVAGQDASFMVAATGTPPLSYQWFFNASPIAGATDSTYTNSTVETNDAGLYSVVVTNVVGSVASSNAQLIVNVPPAITTQPQSASITVGSNVTFAITTTGTLPLSYQWQFNSTNIPGATDGTYTKISVGTNDAGLYSVLVTNVAGSVTSSNATLTLNLPPTITTQPQSATATIGSNVTFTVTASGTAPLSYQWRFNGTNIAHAITSAYACSDVQAGAAGSYSVVVSNIAGTMASTDAVLTIAQTIPLQFDSISLTADSQILLQASGPPAHYAIDATTNLLDWAELTNFTTTASTFQYFDSTTNASQRIYRLRLMP
jgi:uncharacterized repeat protein (TIGR03803 family)